jgi:hypothetical protein
VDSPNLSRVVWRKSTYTQPEGQNCVELASLGDIIAVRDSKDPEGPKLLLAREEWRNVSARIMNGSHDLT